MTAAGAVDIVVRRDQRTAAQHEQQVTGARVEVDKTSRAQSLRGQLVEAMTPDEIAACDNARSVWQAEQDRQAGEKVPAVRARGPAGRAEQTVVARAARDAALAKQLGVHWDPEATGTVAARQAMVLQQAARARELAQQQLRGPTHDHGIEM